MIDEEKQGRRHGCPCRMRVGQGQLKVKKLSSNGPTDRPTDQQTDIVTYRVEQHVTKNQLKVSAYQKKRAHVK